VRDLANQKGQALEFIPSPENIIIKADERRLRQVVGILLDNAVKFTPEHGQIRLMISASPKTHQARISISDTGIGIKSEDFARLFQPFQQLDMRLARVYNGAGLGLVMVRVLVELHGGKVEVESVFGQGSCFTVVLPWEE
jgi:signal transduction histidine kinase